MLSLGPKVRMPRVHHVKALRISWLICDGKRWRSTPSANQADAPLLARGLVTDTTSSSL